MHDTYVSSSIQNFFAINLMLNFVTIGLIDWHVIFRLTNVIVYGWSTLAE